MTKQTDSTELPWDVRRDGPTRRRMIVTCTAYAVWFLFLVVLAVTKGY